MRKDFPYRLKFLMNRAGMKNASDLARCMVENKSVPSCQETKAHDIKSLRRSIDNHLSGTELRIRYLNYYCDFFGCSSDFLLGRIDYPDHKIQHAQNLTGLSFPAINHLTQDALNKNTGFQEILSDIITDPNKREFISQVYESLICFENSHK